MAISLAITEAVTAPDVLAKAKQHMEDRAATYDKAQGERSMRLTVEVFNTFHGTKLSEAQGWHFMEILKRVRLFSRPGYHADSAEDAVAYGALLAEAKAQEGAIGWPSVSEGQTPGSLRVYGGGACPVKFNGGCDNTLGGGGGSPDNFNGVSAKDSMGGV